MAQPIYLADTHCLMWFQDQNPQLPEHVMKILQDPGNSIVYSQVSLLEIAIKKKIGKLPEFTATLDEIFNQSVKDNFRFLPISNNHINVYLDVPLYEEHRDPFDRLIIATAIYENATILTADKHFKLYKDEVNVFW